MAFLGGLFGGSKSTTSTTLSQGTNLSSDVGVNVSADISPNFSFAPSTTFEPTISNAIDLTGFSEAIGAVAGVLQTVADNVNKPEPVKEETGLDKLSKLGGAATAILAMMAIFFAIRDPRNVKVQL
jgi:hypothetical protein